MKAKQVDPAIVKVCPDFYKWPQRWMGMDEDVPYGEGIIQVYAPFILHLVASGSSQKAIRSHCTNLWLLGGELIRQVSTFDEYDVAPEKTVAESVDSEGGPLCRHLDTPSEIRAYDKTCRMLYEFLNSIGRKRPTSRYSQRRDLSRRVLTKALRNAPPEEKSSCCTRRASSRRG